jgi:hypothetical protein
MKGIGMSLEDAMKFWRGEFTKRTDVDVDKFEKEYAYGIRYNYGKSVTSKILFSVGSRLVFLIRFRDPGSNRSNSSRRSTPTASDTTTVTSKSPFEQCFGSGIRNRFFPDPGSQTYILRA